MHNALLISEITGCVIDHLKEDAVRHSKGVDTADTRKTSRLALAVLARTCRTFSEPALDALWHRLDGLKPFFPTRSGEITVDGELPVFHDEEWSIIVSRYAPRVRELRIAQYDTDELSLLWWFPATPLLPNLRKLLWGAEEIAPIRFFLGPSLVHLCVRFDTGDGLVMGFLGSYHILCPKLKSLYLSYSGCRVPLIKTAVSRAIARSPNLTAVACNSIDEAGLMHIANSRLLKRFRAVLYEHKPDDLRKLAAHRNPDHPPFENLRALELHVQDLASIIPLLKSRRQPFKAVTFQFDMAPTSGVLCEFFTALGSTTRRRSLQQISLSTAGSTQQGMPLDAIDFQVLSLLMVFNLHTFDMNLLNPLNLTDDELARLVQAWPDLEMFHLTRQSERDHHSTSDIPTLRGLLLAVERCPKLRDLGLWADAWDVPSLSGAGSSICNTTVTRLFLAYSPIQQSAVEGVAQFLLKHFPALLRVSNICSWSLWPSVINMMEGASGRRLTSEESDSEDEIEIDSDSESVY